MKKSQFFSSNKSCQHQNSAKLAKSQHFHDFFHEKKITFFSSNQSGQQQNSAKPQHFHDFFPHEIRETLFTSNLPVENSFHFDEIFYKFKKSIKRHLASILDYIITKIDLPL